MLPTVTSLTDQTLTRPSIKAATSDGLGPHAAVVTSPDERAYELAMAYIRPGGAVVAVGLPGDGAMFKTSILLAVVQKKRFLTSYVGNRLDAIEALQAVADGQVTVPIVVKPFDALNETYDLMTKGKIQGRVVLDRACLWRS